MGQGPSAGERPLLHFDLDLAAWGGLAIDAPPEDPAPANGGASTTPTPNPGGGTVHEPDAKLVAWMQSGSAEGRAVRQESFRATMSPAASMTLTASASPASPKAAVMTDAAVEAAPGVGAREGLQSEGADALEDTDVGLCEGGGVSNTDQGEMEEVEEETADEIGAGATAKSTSEQGHALTEKEEATHDPRRRKIMRAPPPPPLPPPPPPAPPLAAAATRQPLTLLLVSLVLPALAAAASRLCDVCASIDDFLSDHAQRAADSAWLTILWHAPSEIFSAPEMPTPIRSEPGSEETTSSPVTRACIATFDSSPPSVGGVLDTPTAQAVHQLVHDRRRATIGAAPSYRSPPRTPTMGSPPARGRAHTDDAAWPCYRAGACDDDAAAHWTPPSLCGSPQGSPRAATEGQTLTKVHFVSRELPPDLTASSATGC